MTDNYSIGTEHYEVCCQDCPLDFTAESLAEAGEAHNNHIRSNDHDVDVRLVRTDNGNADS